MATPCVRSVAAKIWRAAQIPIEPWIGGGAKPKRQEELAAGALDFLKAD